MITAPSIKNAVDIRTNCFNRHSSIHGRHQIFIYFDRNRNKSEDKSSNKTDQSNKTATKNLKLLQEV